jgi:hypothetical protein
MGVPWWNSGDPQSRHVLGVRTQGLRATLKESPNGPNFSESIPLPNRRGAVREKRADFGLGLGLLTRAEARPLPAQLSQGGGRFQSCPWILTICPILLSQGHPAQEMVMHAVTLFGNLQSFMGQALDQAVATQALWHTLSSRLRVSWSLEGWSEKGVPC